MFKLPHQQGMKQQPATHPAPWLVVEVDVFLKMHPSHYAPSAWASKTATSKLPSSGKELRAVGLWALQNIVKGGVPAKSRSWKVLRGKVTCHQPPKVPSELS